MIQQAIDHSVEKSQRWDRPIILQAPAELWSKIPSPLKTPKDTLYIHERPGQIAVLERVAISVQRANRELKKYQKNLRQGLIQELVYLRRTNKNSAKDQQLVNNGDWLQEQRFMETAKRELIVLRHRKKKELD